MLACSARAQLPRGLLAVWGFVAGYLRKRNVGEAVLLEPRASRAVTGPAFDVDRISFWVVIVAPRWASKVLVCSWSHAGSMGDLWLGFAWLGFAVLCFAWLFSLALLYFTWLYHFG